MLRRVYKEFLKMIVGNYKLLTLFNGSYKFRHNLAVIFLVPERRDDRERQS